MGRKKHLDEAGIRELEAMPEDELCKMLASRSTEQVAEIVVSLRKSYRIAAMVANVAWKIAKANGAVTMEVHDELNKTLSIYSPANFKPYPSDSVATCQELERLYDFLSTCPNTGVMMEHLFTRIEELQRRIALLNAE